MSGNNLNYLCFSGIMWLLYAIIGLLLALVAYATKKYFDLREQCASLRRELNAQTLDYHLKKISAAGYEYVLRPGKKRASASRSTHHDLGEYRGESRNNYSSNTRSSGKKPVKLRASFDDMLDE